MYVFLTLVGFTGGFLSGLLGIGGGIIMFPILLYLPPLLNIGQIDIKLITGLTMAQSLFASFSGVLIYNKNKHVSYELVKWFGIPLGTASLIGGIFSKYIDDKYVLLIFAVLALAAFILMFLTKSETNEATVDNFKFNKNLSLTVALTLGFFLGIVGQGGAFVVIPALLFLLKVPMRIAIGSTLAIGLLSGMGGFAGKFGTGQIDILMAIALITGAIPAVFLGAAVSKKADVRVLRYLLGALILFTTVKIWWQILI